VKTRSVFRCGECGGEAPKWLGRCPTCEAWNSLVEELEGDAAVAAGWSSSAEVVALADVDANERPMVSTGVDELDRVLGGGLVPGSVTLVGGEPGIGKSTLLLQVLSSMARRGSRCLLVTAEESAQQVRRRADRLGAVADGLHVLAETALPAVVDAVIALDADVVVVDSIQTVVDPTSTSAPGTVAQVRDCTHRLVRLAKERACSIVLVGHVTKEGNLAGPRVLEHLVDTVLSFDGDRHHALRLLHSVKHRFGGTGELGLMEMTDDGLIGVPDASGMLLADRRPGGAGSVVVPTIEGSRPLLVEVQALAYEVHYVPPRRAAQGVDSARLALLLAVLEKRAGIQLAKSEVYASAVGGVRLTEPGADLALALAIASSVSNRPVPSDLVACAEIGLAGELRQPGQLERRLVEAWRLGFRTAIVPTSAPPGPEGMQTIGVATLHEAIRRTGL
jgi:DNA repair protein RadA/Sms